MNREIKFRAWDNLNSKWVYFTIGQTWSEIALIVYHRIILNGGVFYQYTGLKDRNGKEVYEGDVVKVLRGHPVLIANTYRIEYINAAFQMLGKGNKIPTAFVTYTKQALDHGIEFEEIGELIKVIGNIHENPELL